MHCIEIMSSNFQAFKARVKQQGGTVSVVSRYQDRGIRWVDVEVSKDTKAIDRIEQEFAVSF